MKTEQETRKPRDWREVLTDPGNVCYGLNCTQTAEKSAPFDSGDTVRFVGYCKKHYDEWEDNNE